MNRPAVGDISATRARVHQGLARRYRAERRFRFYGLLSVAIGLLALVVLFGDIIAKGHGAFIEHHIELPVHFDPALLGVDNAGDRRQLDNADFGAVIDQALDRRFPSVTDPDRRRRLHGLVSIGAGYHLRDTLAEHAGWLGQSHRVWLLADGDADLFLKGDAQQRADSRLGPDQRHWLNTLETAGQTRAGFNLSFFTRGDSREPELAGIRGALMGSFFTMLVTLCLSFPIGVAAALYLEEFAPRNRFTDFIEVNINNLAAVPSIIFGLLGLAIFIGVLGLPRSVPLLAGLVLTLMTLPTIIISSRAAIRAVPPSVRQAALALGASPMQVVLHQVLPLSLPGMLTGTIIGMAQALGETAPLLLIGMVAFIVDVPGGPLDPSTVLPVQIYLWAGSPEQSFVAMTSAAILVLLAFLLAMNTLAVVLRKRLERRW